MMTLTPTTRFGILTFLTLLGFFASAPDASACGCSSGCGMVTQGLSADVKQLMETAKAQGRKPISCIRTQACQDRLRRCYERCGQYGRAARRSAHSDGKACDYHPHHRGPLRALKGKLGLRNITDILHRPGHGGGAHVFTTRYTRSSGDTAQNRPNQNRPARRGEQNIATPAHAPLPPERPQREPADAGENVPLPPQRASGAYEQMPNGKYRCPTSLRSICGSTRDTEWCQGWMQRGKTPGCY
jgi:hypothetical protein